MVLSTQAVRRSVLILAAATLIGAHAPALAQTAGGPPIPLEDDARVPPDAPSMVMVAEAAATGDVRIDALLSGYKWNLTTITYSFYEDSVFHGTYYGTETGVREVSEPVKQNVRQIMAHYGTLVNVNFVEVVENSSTVGHVRVMCSDVGGYAYAYYPSSTSTFHVGGDVHLNCAYDRTGDTNGFQHPAGEHGYSALIHEIGHAIGLKHPHQGTPTLPTANDNNTNTMMSYAFLGESPGTPMGYDVMALQYNYGARATRSGADTYLFTRSDVDQFSVNGQVTISPSYAAKQAVWDAGGYNVLDLSGIAGNATGYRIDLKPLGWITTNASYKTTYYSIGTTLGPGVRIHKIVNSVSADTIYANADANVFAGYSPSRTTGADVIHDATEADTVDLSAFASTQVTQTANGNDLVLGLGTKGSITLKNYYAGNRPVIAFTAGAPKLSVSDVQVTEGHTSYVNATFTVTLSQVVPSPIAVNYTTSNGSGIAGTDYQATSGTLIFAASETTRTVSVPVLGDRAVEGHETFSLLLSAPSAGVEIADAQGDATIVDDDVATNVAPTAVITASTYTGVAPLAISFSGASSTDSDGSIVGYAWSFGTGATSTAAAVNYTFATAGTYTVTLTVTDNKGLTGVKSVLVTVQSSSTNLAPIATAGAAPTIGPAPLSVSFTSSGSMDADGSIAVYLWTFGNGATSNAAHPSYTYTTPGTYTATLKVTDNRGLSSTRSLTITVQQPQTNQPPVPVLTANPTTGPAPLAVDFSGAASTDADGTIVSYQWSFGTGDGSTAPAPGYTYTKAGTFTATLTVTDNKGGRASKSVTITVTSTPSSASPLVFVSDIAMEVVPYTAASSTAWVAKAYVTVKDGAGNPVPGAVVTARWFGLAPSSNTYAYTGADGKAVFTSRYVFQQGGFGLSVSNVVKSGLTYDATRNVETSDSITFYKPASAKLY